MNVENEPREVNEVREESAVNEESEVNALNEESVLKELSEESEVKDLNDLSEQKELNEASEVLKVRSMRGRTANSEVIGSWLLKRQNPLNEQSEPHLLELPQKLEMKRRSKLVMKAMLTPHLKLQLETVIFSQSWITSITVNKKLFGMMSYKLQ